MSQTGDDSIFASGGAFLLLDTPCHVLSRVVKLCHVTQVLADVASQDDLI